MDDTTVLVAVRDADSATAERIARSLDADPGTIEDRLAELESAGRVEFKSDEWRLARDPRLDSSIERMCDRLGREKL